MYPKFLQDEVENVLLLSPYGLVHALSMLLPASGVGTASHAALLKVLFKGLSDESEAQRAVQDLSAALRDAQTDGVLEWGEGNAAFVGKSLALKDAYAQSLKTSYGAEILKLESADFVNSWVAKATKDKITEVIDQNTASQAAFILINAIYFKGLWEAPFHVRDTRNMPFYTLQGTNVEAPLMYLHYEKGSAVQGYEFTAKGTHGNVECAAVRLHYKGGQFSAVFSMPLGDVQADSNGNLVLANSGSRYSDSLSACQDTILSSWDLNSISWRPIGPGGYSSAKIYLPKFEVTSDQSLSGALAGLGLSPIFKPGDFDRLADVGDIFVSEVKQKVYIKVDEEGTEAAAVTSIVMMRAMIKPMNELFLKFDRPFHLSILHNDSGIALFTGTIHNPVSNDK